MSQALPSTPTAWQAFSAAAMRHFHAYANWLVGISWKRFFVLSVLLLIISNILANLPPFNWTIRETVTERPSDVVIVPKPPTPPKAASPAKPEREPAIKIERPGGDKDADVDITIGRDGIRIRKGKSPAAAASQAAASAASAAADVESRAASAAERGVRIELPPGATSEAVKAAVEEARKEIMGAIDEARQDAQDAAEAARTDAEQASVDAASVVKGTRKRIERTSVGEFFPNLALLWIVASIITKITYKGRMQAEVKAAQATETAESESLKRQVVEARMAAMQAQVEPHFLFNTLASIDHLIETDPPRASTMQKNLIALLRASMPTLREAQPSAHNLGREMAVIKPYLEILKVRMEERLQTDVNVPEGLLSAEFPSMMIQSLVENAIKHGLEPKPEGGRLSVKAEINHGKLAVTVADTGLGFGKAATAGTGIGLNNIRERLKLLYGNRASMTVSENAPTGTVVTLTVPYLAQAREGETA
jgi:Histidine kinase